MISVIHTKTVAQGSNAQYHISIMLGVSNARFNRDNMRMLIKVRIIFVFVLDPVPRCKVISDTSELFAEVQCNVTVHGASSMLAIHWLNGISDRHDTLDIKTTYARSRITSAIRIDRSRMTDNNFIFAISADCRSGEGKFWLTNTTITVPRIPISGNSSLAKLILIHAFCGKNARWRDLDFM